MSRRSRSLAVATALLVAAPAGAVIAGEWEVEAHLGGLMSLSPSGGQAAPPPLAEPFQTVEPGVTSHRVPSWYFGSGGQLLEQTRSTVSTGYFNYSRTTTVFVGTLDATLTRASVHRPAGTVAGVRIGRRLGRRFSAEVDVEYSRHSPELSQAARNAVRESQASFEASWGELLSSLPEASVSSEATVHDGTGRRLLATAVLNVNLLTGDAPRWSRRPARHRFVSYLSLGAGLVSTSGEEPSATLVGRYRFASPESGAPFEETDTVTVRAAGTVHTAFVGVVGLGWKKDVSDRWGLRMDARVYLSRNATRTVLDARPSVSTGSPPSALVVDSDGIGAIQFVNNSSGPYEGHRSSLAGPAISGLETFQGTGILTQVNVTLGAFLRF
jgi:hypothetical protein